ncbi:FtsX-like permease family protein [Flammeovirgaceae bacterium SG7u.111]|nr:FtsX-like permease family protein [Flammeovirgaceae bacterium SG7u.132]WPO33482.1 FtsX-like permease family protein [Flammeovirgaceae bacterium SG7u.111]
MKFNISLFVANRLRAKEGSSFSLLISRIAIGSIAVGLAVMIGAFAVFKGFKTTIQDKIFSFTSHIRLSKFDMSNSYEEIPVSTSYDIYQNAANLPGVDHIQVYSRKPGLLQTKDEVLGVTLKGVGRDFDSLFFKKNITQGRFPDLSGEKYSTEILVSKYIADKLLLGVGDEVIMTFAQDPPRIRKLQIVGIYTTWIEDFDKILIVGDNRMIQRLNNWGDTLVGGFEVTISDFSDLEETSELVWDEMDFDLALFKVTDEYVQFFDWFVMLTRNVYVFMFVILFVACFNVVSITLIMIMERTNMVGTLKAIGATNWQIQKIFAFNGVKMITQGLLWGNAVGITFGVLQQKFKLVPLDPENYYMDAVPIAFDWGAIIGLNILFIVLISIVLVLPTIIISRINPIRAIKFS